LFFHLLDLSVLSSYILLTSCGSKLTHHDFRLTLVRVLIQKGGGGCLDQRTPHRADQLLPPVNRHDLTFDTLNTGPQKEDEFAAACVLQNIKKCGQNSAVLNAMWGCVLIPASRCTTHKCIFEDCLTLCWKKWNTKCKYCNFTITSSVPAMLLRGNIPKPNI
jgi:hypothetical protein